MLRRFGVGDSNSKVSAILLLLLGVSTACIAMLITVLIVMKIARFRPVLVPLVLSGSPLIGLLFYAIVNQKDTRAKPDAGSSIGNIAFRDLGGDVEIVSKTTINSPFGSGNARDRARMDMASFSKDLTKQF
jgi:hypothetical protein